jgi:Phospholipase_D-nuclease N-terminal
MQLLALLDGDLPASGGGMVVGLGAFVFVIWAVVILATVFWLWMLIDALVNEPTTNDKILWFLVIFFLHFVGALVYFFVRRSARRGVPG